MAKTVKTAKKDDRKLVKTLERKLEKTRAKLKKATKGSKGKKK
ncbi:hypothetical protein SAMN03159343_1709 [Klenkia marina]|uniref:Uncharacterized protein n=1 Tax=Klenkia marina TaxID=1960309 RepID=A0A1G4XXT0_9ACTN|nr:hypothetical protein [Klenkia marina]SCX45950.1 hypothetical protein SAMN03159343_1709 [Klenkia marina]